MFDFPRYGHEAGISFLELIVHSVFYLARVCVCVLRSLATQQLNVPTNKSLSSLHAGIFKIVEITSQRGKVHIRRADAYSVTRTQCN
jgi:hypothetical protein